MADQASPNGKAPDTQKPAEDARAKRLKAALKANMAKRKAQARARAAGETGAAGDETKND